MLSNAKQFEKALNKAKIALSDGKLHSAVAWAQIGADFAWLRHPGFYACRVLESFLVEVANQLTAPRTVAVGRLTHNRHEHEDKTHVLHVMTQAYKTGGHSRVVAGWIRNTSDAAIHSLVTTAQRDQLPADIMSSIVAAGGWYESLAAKSGDLLNRSLLLRMLGRNWADLIVLHVHPSDALPVVAFGVDGGPPVIFFNHADHAFWIGGSVADVTADIRPSGQAITVTRRGVKNSRLLPIPLWRVPPSADRESFRRQLGVKDDTVVLLTVGAEYKYTPFSGYDFVGTLTKILKRRRNTVLLAVGPGNSGKWTEASALVDGRIRALGLVDWADLSSYFACADIYLESFPFGGLTALLEAGNCRLPLLGLRILEAPAFTGADDVALDKLGTHASSLEAYTQLLENMIDQPALRDEKITAVKKGIESKHLPPGWNKFLEDITLGLPSQHVTELPNASDMPANSSEIFKGRFDAEISKNEQASYSFAKAILRHAKYLPRNEILLEGLWHIPSPLLGTRGREILRKSQNLLRGFLRAFLLKEGHY
jgi:hypothetical protein